MVAALFVDPAGCYSSQVGVDPWPEARDARTYAGPHPVVAHPPCQRWGRFATGGTHPNAPRRQVGDDGGCFEAALRAVRAYGGVLEHPKDSKAWAAYGLAKPPSGGGWVKADDAGGWTCCVWQGHYGHFSGKATWLYANGVALPELRWGRANVPLPAGMVAKHGERKARKIGAIAWVGGKDKTRIREATPPAFRDLLLGIARNKLAHDSAHAIPAWGVVPASQTRLEPGGGPCRVTGAGLTRVRCLAWRRASKGHCHVQGDGRHQLCVGVKADALSRPGDSDFCACGMLKSTAYAKCLICANPEVGR